MNELQLYTASISDEDPNKIDLIKQWKIDNKWNIDESVKKEVVVDQPGAAVTTTPNEASESLDGASQSLRPYIDFLVENTVLDETDEETTNEQPRRAYIDYDPSSSEEILKTLPNNSKERTQYYIQNELALDKSINEDLYNRYIGNIEPASFTNETIEGGISGEDIKSNFIPWEYDLNANELAIRDYEQIEDAELLDTNPEAWDAKMEQKRNNTTIDLLEQTTKSFRGSPTGANKNLDLSPKTIDGLSNLVNNEGSGLLEPRDIAKELQKLNNSYPVIPEIDRSGKDTSYNDYLNEFTKQNDLDIDYLYNYYNQDKSTSFVDANYGGKEALETIGINPYDFEGFLMRSGYVDNFDQDVKDGIFITGSANTEYSQEEKDLAKERQLQSYMQAYMSMMDERTNQRITIEDLLKNDDLTIGIGKAKGKLKQELRDARNEASYTGFNLSGLDAYEQNQFGLAYDRDIEYRNANIKYQRELDNRGDAYAAVANFGTFVKEGIDGFGYQLQDAVEFMFTLAGNNKKARQTINSRIEKDLENEQQAYLEFYGKTTRFNGIEYAKNDQGQLFNTTAGYLIEPGSAGSLSAKDVEKISKLVDESETSKRHYSLRGYMGVGGYVVGNVAGQIVGLKGTGLLTKAVKLRALATLNGFTSVKKYQKIASIEKLMSFGKAPVSGGVNPLKFLAKKSTIDATLTQMYIGGYIGYNETLKAAKLAGFSNEEAADLASDAAQDMSILFGVTGPVSTRATWFNNVMGTKNLGKTLRKLLLDENGERVTQAVFQKNLKLQLLNIGVNLKNSGINFAYEGGKETIQENLQQAGQYLWVNKELNTQTGVDFLQDTYTLDEIRITSKLSFMTGGLMSQLQMPNFKPRSRAQLANYIYVAQNSDAAEIELNKLVEQNYATQEQVNELLDNARAIYNMSPSIPEFMLDGDNVLDLSVILQEISDLKIKKKTHAEAFHPDIDIEIAALEEAAEGLVADAVFEQATKKTEGAKKIAGQTRTEFIDADTQDEVDLEIKKLKDRGAIIDEKNSSDYGTFLTLKDGSKVIIINKASAQQELVMTTGNHETGHNLLFETFKNRPEVAIAFGKAVLLEIESGKNLTFNNNEFKINLMKYVNDANYSEGGVAEEIITLLSEGLDSTNNWVTFNETGATRIGDIIRRSLSALGIKVRFNKGKDVINFIRDYNKSIDEGDGLSLGMQTTALEGGKGKLTKADKDSNKTIRSNVDKSLENVTVYNEDGSLESISRELFEKNNINNPDSGQLELEIDSETKVINALASKKRGTSLDAKTLAKKYKNGKITPDEMGSFYNQYLNIALSTNGLAFDSRTKVEGKQPITRNEAKSFVGQFFPDIMKRWNPDKEANIPAWITANIRPKKADFYGKEQKLEEKGRQTSMSDERLTEIASTETADFDAKTTTTQKETKIINPGNFSAVKPKIKEIESIVKIKPEQVTSLTYKTIADKYVGPVGTALTGLSAAKITGNETLNYGLKNNDASKLQMLFKNTQEVKDFIESMPKFNVATNETIINEQGENIEATSDAKGYSLGINPKVLKQFYKSYVDPTGKMTSKSGRSKGKTSQTQVKIKDFKATIANAKKLQKLIGITESGELNVPIKGPARTEFGTLLQGLSKLYVTNLTNTIARKNAKELLKDLKTAKDPKKILADMGAGKSNALAAKKRAPRGTRDFNEIIRQLGGTVLKSSNLDVNSSKMPKIILDYLKNNPITVLDENEIDITEKWTEDLEKDLDRLFKSKKENFNDFDENFSEIKRKYPELNQQKVKKAITKSFFDTIKANKDVLKYRSFVREKLFPVFPKSFFTSGTFAGGGTSGPNRNFFYYAIGDLDLDNNKFAKEDSDITAAVTRVGYTTGSGELRKITESWYTNEFLTGNQDVLNKEKLKGLKKIFKVFETLLKDKSNAPFIAALLSSTSQGMGGLVRVAAPITFVGNNLINGIVEEHTMPASFVAKYLFEAAINGSVDADFKNIEKNYQQGALGKLDDNKLKGSRNGVRFNYTKNMPENWKFTDSVWDRYFNINTASQNGGIDGNDYTMADGKTLFETLNVTSSGMKVGPVTMKSMKRAQKSNSGISDILNKNSSTQKQINTLENIDKALANGRSLNTPEKGISIFDFDDTLAKTNSKIVVTMPESVQSVTNTGDAKKVINTVYKSVINSVANNSNINTISFSSEFSEKSRVKLYNSLANKLSKDLGWELEVFETVDSTGNTDIVTSEDFTLNKGKDAKKIKGDKNAIKFKKDVADNLKSSFNINGKTYDISLDFLGEGDYSLEFSLRGKSKGKTYKINATEFAEQSVDLEAQGAEFNFDEFNKVVDGKKGPLADLALKRQGKFGSKDIFVLTARPQLAAPEIYEFLKNIGLEVPLENITGLENGSPQAKADWIVDKAAKGYNDFYFADDAIKNVKAVKEVLEQIDVKSKVQLAKASKKRTFDTVFNDIIESSTGIKSYKNYSEARAKVVGKTKSGTTFFIPPSAEDFTGLLYKMLGKGKVGDAQFKFFKDNLLDPYNRAEISVTQAKISTANDFKALKNNLKTLPKKLSKQTGIGKFSFGQAARVAVWTRQGMTIPGLSKTDLKKLNDFVDANEELSTFANELINIQKGKAYPAPSNNWVAGTIVSDIISGIDKVNRKEYLREWQENVDIIFSDKNMNKLEAAYGPKYVEALRDSIRRMKSGSNRPIGGSRVVNEVLDWLNNSVGTVMFLNRRSGILQTISAINFIDFGDNNIFKAGKAFANQPQFWGDFMTLINSPYLVERRDGLKINVSESEIADAVAESDNKVKSAIAYLLSKGFVFTRYADSFAIASGGATFYRNRLNALVKDGMNLEDAKKQAFEDFRAIAETNQQSSSPSKISQQQASAAGRVILAFANTPMQYARIQKRAIQDLVAGRGDWRSNVSKIAYYGIIQNLIFNALQNALFLMLFDDDDEQTDEEKQAKLDNKSARIANGMLDSLLRGLGIKGAAVSAVKNVLLKIGEESGKKSTKYREAVFEVFDFSPPLDAKVRKLRSAGKSFDWNMKKIKKEGFNLNNPAYLAGGQIISASVNVPLDRVVSDINSLRQIFNKETEGWQKVALALGWSTWDVGLPYYGVNKAPIDTPATRLENKINLMKKETNTKEQKIMLLNLGLTVQEVKDLKYEGERIKKIMELEEKYKDNPRVRDSLVDVNTLKRELNALNKSEQVTSLIELGLSTEEIKDLKYEIDRVNKIIELQNNEQ